jgi:hypothetical protein
MTRNINSNYQICSYHKTRTTSTIALWPSTFANNTDPTYRGGNFGVFAGQPTTAASGDKFRNDYNGEVGYTFVTSSQPLSLTAVGRSGAKLKAGARVTVWDSSTKKAVASAVGASKTCDVIWLRTNLH